MAQVGIEARVTFEAYTGTRVTSYLEVINDGTTSVFFDWKVKRRATAVGLQTLLQQALGMNSTHSVCVN